MSYITNVCVLHCGGDEETHFIQYLENALASYQGPAFVLEYTKFQENQTKEIVLFNDAQRYKKEKVPLIVLISMKLFELIWPTSHKQGILNVITSYSTKNVLHIWMDVTEEDVKRRSNALMRRDNFYRRIKAHEMINQLQPPDMIKKVQSLLGVDGDGKLYNPLNNYAVDNEIDDMKKNFELSNLGHIILEDPVEPVVNEPPRKPKKKNDPYKNALRMANMSPEEQQAFSRDLNTQQENNTQSQQPSKKKKKKKRTGGIIKYMNEVSSAEIQQIATYLGKGHGANWRQLAENFDYTPDVIKGLVDTIPVDFVDGDQFRSEQFLEMLRTDKPDLEIAEFVLKCRQIMRNDVVTYIRDNILG